MLNQYHQFEFHDTGIPGVCLFVPTVAHDDRGQILSLHTKQSHERLGVDFVEDKISRSRRNVLRGFHGDDVTGKLLICLSGEIFVAVADLRPASPTLGSSLTFGLSEWNNVQLYVPPGVFNAHLCLSRRCLFYYKMTMPYSGAEAQRTLLWNDADLAVPWPCKEPILSARDLNGLELQELLQLSQ